MDREGKPVTLFKERISRLVEELGAASDIIGIPTPALAETLVRSGPNRAQYMKILGDSWKFQLLPFDSRAAIEAAELIALVKKNKDQWDTWAKVKFDIQIVAIAKAEEVSVIYSDDKDLENFAKRFNIRVVRICDLPVPPPEKPKPIESGPIGVQAMMFGPPSPPLIPFPEVKLDEGSIPSVPQTSQTPAPPRADGAPAQSSDQLQATPAHPAPVQGSDSGRAQNEAPSEADKEVS